MTTTQARVIAMATIAGLLTLSGCLGPGFEGILVDNFTEEAAGIQVVLVNGTQEVYNETILLAAGNTTMVHLQIANGDYRVTARSGSLERSETVTISRDVQHLKIELTPTQISISRAIT